MADGSIRRERMWNNQARLIALFAYSRVGRGLRDHARTDYEGLSGSSLKTGLKVLYYNNPHYTPLVFGL